MVFTSIVANISRFVAPIRRFGASSLARTSVLVLGLAALTAYTVPDLERASHGWLSACLWACLGYFAIDGAVRANFYEVFALQQRLAILLELVRLAEQGVEQGKNLLAGQRIARLDLIQLEVEVERFRAEAAAVERELPAAFRKLAAVTGEPRLPPRRLAAAFEQPPDYDLDAARDAVLAFHPQARSARVGVVATTVTPGAGGTIANNLVAMRVGRVAVLGAVGDDGFGYELRGALTARS